ncbi:class B sortase [Cohnella cholangitidis]|uniref:Class B sortase n=1 Tax=Cohnella cholangitidis TaxID=2598458 RepID=A0A7G5C444_9BACL|nr:class B sortase [Cohnella cholangitidis]QMV43978.1 class B sortase [Cohnella cholangitidis]
MQKSIRIALSIISLGVFTYSLVMIVEKYYSSYRDNRQYEQLRVQVAEARTTDIPKVKEQIFQIATPDAPVEDEKIQNNVPYEILSGDPVKLDENGVLKQYSELHMQNSDFIGWIEMPGFNKPIDYPVMQAEDNDFYLKRDFNKKHSISGTIFMDYTNNPREDRNIVLYGHAMNDRTMFGDLMDFYREPDKYEKLTKIYLDFLDVQMEYEIFSTYTELQDYNYRQADFADDKEFMDFLIRINDKSVYDYHVDLTPQDKILTLSTCNNKMGAEYRTVIHARLVTQTKYNNSTAL